MDAIQDALVISIDKDFSLDYRRWSEVASHASNSKLWNHAPEHSDAFDPRGGAYKHDFRHCNLMKGFPHFRYPTEHACDT
ncbi:hypothetical protein CEXT_296461 [Caerostris extrusa]|uniref:Uncharacterized protein n=1 Tax=Caerostris extrusa TaxID=172846 RepID=A0AAV4P0K4_CAEEX|nr:hypothetical protein CEXT_296461 [Caerostris extrusa]